MDFAEPSFQTDFTRNGSRFQIIAPEILAQILGHTIHVPNRIEKLAFKNDVIMSKTNPPWPFLLVCRHWYNVVMSNPTLWSNIVLVLNSCFEVDLVRLSSVLDAHLKRSEEAPLTLALFLYDDYFRYERNYDPTEVGPIRKVLEKLMPTQHRWQNVALHMHFIEYPHDPLLNPPIPKDFSIRLRDMKALVNLEIELNIEFHPSEHSINMWPVNIELSSCTHLQTIKLVSGVSVKEAPAEVCLANLRRISIRIQTDERAMAWWNLLQHSPNVEHLEISCVGAPPRHSVPLVNLPNLRRLEVRGAYVAHVLQWFTLPPSVELTASYVDLKLCDEEIATFSHSLKLKKFTVKHIMLELAPDHVPSYREEVLQDLFSCFMGVEKIKFASVPEVSYGKLCASLTSAVSTSDHDTSSRQGALLPRLVVFEMKILLSEPSRKIDTSSIRQFILACRKSYDYLDFRFSVFESGIPLFGLRKEIALDILTDEEIQSCITARFLLSVDGYGSLQEALSRW